ncbi:histidine kinase [Thalassotalea sp. 1_MG-2023]|uniref:sensor histidine kinase n=1 Tax=Thalassotalea sp. 1_MG-2023 TaxID=3062680 RepID=UPI0026E39D36|nr:histidine kinase [Thalassotalea sp. 1_MG-2023]MDO6427232.1 histidine kinase [Thalassotalea sp. 1_MG-2023]
MPSNALVTRFSHFLFSPVMPFSLYIFLLMSYSYLTAPQHTWLSYSHQFIVLCLIISPVLWCKYQSLRSEKIVALTWWAIGFIILPLGHLILSERYNSYEKFFDNTLGIFIYLAVIEAIIFLKRKMKPLNLSKFKDKVTMDNILLAIIVCFSLFWSLVFNSIDNPMENQPIHILIDIKRNLLRIDELLLYFIQFFAFYLCGYFIYWVNHHVLINNVMARFGVFHYLWAACTFTLIAAPLLSQLILFLPINNVEFTLLPSGNHDPFDIWNLRITFIIMMISLPLILAFKWQQQVAEVSLLKQQNTEAELKWLQQQINPHFLFNTLNNLYSLVLTNKSQAPQCILQLSNLLRFVVYKGGNHRVSLKDEIAYLTDYMALQEIRVSHKANITVNIDPKLAGNTEYKIAPLLLIVLIENAFKHGIDATDKSVWLSVDLSLKGNELSVRCHNSIDDRLKIKQKESQEKQIDGGLGLENLQRRLALDYTNKHQLNISAQPHEFLVILTIELENNG